MLQAGWADVCSHSRELVQLGLQLRSQVFKLLEKGSNVFLIGSCLWDFADNALGVLQCGCHRDAAACVS